MPPIKSLEFIGEDIIDHTPKNETVRIKLGSAFDVVGERKQVDFAVDSSAKWIEEEIEVKLRNHKEVPVTVLVKENLYRWSNWKIIKKSQDYDKEDARTIYFPVTIAKDGEATVRYRVRYYLVARDSLSHLFPLPFQGERARVRGFDYFCACSIALICSAL